MKILMTGGGTGGHFYPLIAVAEEIRNICLQEKILAPELYFMAPDPYNTKILFDNEITFIPCMAGKKRVGGGGTSSILNFIDMFKMGLGVLSAIVKLYSLFPDVVFAKGGYTSFPALMAARILGIPVIIHESDSTPGRVNAWAGKFAQRVAISYKEAVEYLPKEKTAFVGNIVRKDVREPLEVGAYEYLKLNTGLKTIMVVGGSQGAQIINDTLINSLTDLLEKYQIIHQAGTKNFEEIKSLSDVILTDNPHKNRYNVYPYLNKLALRMSAGVADVIISRAGAGFIAEIACWGKPSIIVPISKSNGDHQRKNAYHYATTGACQVLEEKNLTPHVFVSEIVRILENQDIQNKMKEATKQFVHPDAEDKIAEEIIKIGLAHEN